MMPVTKKLLGQFDPTAQRPTEPDYIFVVNKRRVQVLEDQFVSLNDGDESESKQKNLRWKKFRHSQDPDNKMVVLVYFSDDIMNKEAEDQELII